MATAVHRVTAPKFLRTLYTILHTEPQDILAWAPCGTHFQVFDVDRLETRVLPRYFKHNKFASFQRQLNNFGFRKWTKTRASVCTFSHDTLVRCHPSELHVAANMELLSRKRQRADTEIPTASAKKTKVVDALECSIDLDTENKHTDATDVWSLDWALFYGEDIEILVDEDTVGLPLELLFLDEKELEMFEPLPVSEACVVDVCEWKLLAECLA